MNREEVLNTLGEKLQELWKEQQARPTQYVVAYFKKEGDELIGYHSSSFCQVTKDILQAKRYSGEDPYPQLGVILKNLKYTLDVEGGVHTSIFAAMLNQIKDEDFGGLKSSDIYMDAIYLADGTPTQECRWTVVGGDDIK